MRPFRLLALSVLLLGSAGARADEIGPAQAQALQQQLKDWAAGLLGPSVKLPEPAPWHVSADHDHYVVTWPVPGLTTPSGGEPAISAKVRPLDSSRWSVDRLTVPPSGSFTMALDKPSVRVEFSIGHQDTNAVIDPTFASASKLHSELSDISLKSEGDRQRQEQQFDHYVTDTTVTPRGDGLLDVMNEATGDGWNSASQINGVKPVAVALGVRTVHATAQVSGVNRERVASLLAAAAGTINALAPGFGEQGDSPGLPPAARAQLRLAVEAMQDIASSIRLEETLDGVRIEIAGVGGVSINRILMGMGGESTDGRLHAWIDLALDDPASPSLPPKIAAYLPHHLAIKPTMSGVVTADLHRLALDATDVADDRFAQDLAAMFSHGGVEFGLEKLSLDVGVAKVEGTGTITVSSPAVWHGKAHLEAAGLDELIAQARNGPDLQSALPALIMLRGLAKPEGERLAWDVVSDGASTTVNGVDLSQLGGGGKSKPGQPPVRRPGQAPSR